VAHGVQPLVDGPFCAQRSDACGLSMPAGSVHGRCVPHCLVAAALCRHALFLIPTAGPLNQPRCLSCTRVLPAFATPGQALFLAKKGPGYETALFLTLGHGDGIHLARAELFELAL